MNLKNVIRHGIIGVSYGAITYLLVIAFGVQGSVVTAKNVFSVLIMSSLIGIVTLIFDYERITFLLSLCIHFIATFLLVIGMVWYNGWLTGRLSFSGLYIFLTIYIIIFLINFILSRQLANKINKQLKARNRQYK